MRLTFFVVWKSWVSNPVRTVLTILGVAIGIAVVTAIHVLDHNTIQSRLHQRLADYGHVDVEMLPKDADAPAAEQRTRLLAMDELVSDVGLLHGGPGGAEIRASKPSGPAIEAVMYGLSPLRRNPFAHYNLASGDNLDDLDGDAYVLIAEVLAKQLGIGLGDDLEVAPSVRAPTQRCVDGKLVEVAGGQTRGETVKVKVKGLLSNHALARRNSGLVVVAPFSLARRVTPFAMSFYQVNRRPGANPDDLKRALATHFQILDQRSAMVGEGSDERAFRNGIKILGLLALVMGMLVVFQTLSQTLMERLRQIGLMRCLGASRQAVAMVFLVDGLLLAVLGAVVGVAVGIALAWTMAQMEWTTLGVGKQIVDFEVPFRPVAFAAGLGLFFTLCGSAFPLFKARNLPPVRVLQARGLGDSGYLLRGVNVFLFVMLVGVLPVSYLAMTPLVAEEGREERFVLLQVAGIVMLFGGLLLIAPRIVTTCGRALLVPLRRRLPLPAFMVEKIVTRAPGRFASAVCGLSVVLVSMVALKHITYALWAEVRQFSAASMDDHLFFRDGPPTRVADLSRVRAIPGVESAEFFTGTANVGFLLRGVPVDCLVREGGALEGNLDLIEAYRSQRTMIVSSRWAELHWKKAGQTKSLVTGTGSKDYTILQVTDEVGFFPDDRAWAVTDSQWLQKDFCIDAQQAELMALTVAPNAKLGPLREQVSEVFPHKWFKTGNDHREYLLRDVTRDFLLFDVLLFLILCLVGMGLVNTMTIAAVGRAREIGVLRALGMGNRALRQMFLLEGSVVAVIGALVAVLIGLPLGHVVVTGLNTVAGLQAPIVIPWLYLALVPVLALATGLLAAILPGSRAVKMNASEAIRYE